MGLGRPWWVCCSSTKTRFYEQSCREGGAEVYTDFFPVTVWYLGRFRGGRGEVAAQCVKGRYGIRNFIITWVFIYIYLGVFASPHYERLGTYLREV